ncbi:MAG: ABC-type transport auxiliary lipoprotein family protein [Caulobacteraceae bacterium]|nr:ABC-type transport auxiliary lipoprotein family protein [Caulobacteraceae bacterium]
MNQSTLGRLGLAAGLALALGLGGCVTLLPKTAPVQLYRFDVAGADVVGSPPAAAVPDILIQRAPTTFVRAAGSDRILTVTGDQIAYIADARWVSAASTLFDEAETRAFDRSAGPVRLTRRGETLNAPAGLRLDVQTFEVRYGAGAGPTVVVQVRASLTRSLDRKPVAAQIFESRQKVASNRVGGIVPGFDAAVTDVLGQIITWTNAQVAAPDKP